MTPTLLLALALAQSPKPDARTVTPAAVQRAAATLRLLQVARTGQLGDPALQSAVEAFLKANPDIGPGALPGLLQRAGGTNLSPELLNQAKEFAKGYAAKQAAPGAVPPDSQAPTPPESPTPPAKQPEPRDAPDDTFNPFTPPGVPDAGGAGGANGGVPGRASPGATPPPGAPDDRGGEAIRWWEQNVGPLDKTPAFKGVVQEFLRGVDPSAVNRGPLGKLLSGANGQELGEWAAALADALGGFKGEAAGAAAAMPEVPELALPATPALDGLPRLGVAAVAVGLLVAAAFFWRRLGTAARGTRPGEARVSAPKPASVRDRETLIVAVDRLGRHRLGPEALPLNHRALGRALLEAGAPAAAVARLVGLYELARYAPAGDGFPAEQLPAARDALAAVLAVRS